jgi:hypothetical protein
MSKWRSVERRRHRSRSNRPNPGRCYSPRAEHRLTPAISELRRVFGDDAKDSRFIQTIPKSGYRLIARLPPGGVDVEMRDSGNQR